MTFLYPKAFKKCKKVSILENGRRGFVTLSDHCAVVKFELFNVIALENAVQARSFVASKPIRDVANSRQNFLTLGFFLLSPGNDQL